MNHIVRGSCRLAVYSLSLLPVMNAQDKPKESISPGNSMRIWQARAVVGSLMKLCHRILILTALIILIFIPEATLAQQQPAQLKMPSNEQVTIFRALRNLPCRTHDAGQVCHDLQYRGRTIDFDFTTQKKNSLSETTHYTIDLTTLAKVTNECKQKRHWSGIVSYKYTGCDFLVGGQTPSRDLAVLLQSFRTRDNNFDAACLNRLHEYSLQPEQLVAHFHEAAAAWRALPQRPPISDAVRVQRLLAEEAIKQGQPYMALYYYEVGLEKDPLWPEGYFNAALVAASVDVYAQAAEHMQHYLELLPDAPDAQAARDQIGMWQIKAKEK